MQAVCFVNVLLEVTYMLIWIQGVAFSLAIEPMLCCRLVLNTRSTIQARSETTGFSVSGSTALGTELKAYRGGPMRKHHLDSMGLPQITGMSTANPVLRFSSVVWD